MYFRQLFDPVDHAYTYLLADAPGGDAVVIDPSLAQATLILALLQEAGLRLRHVLRTHVHPPARSSCGQLCEHTGAGLIVGRGCGLALPGRKVGHGDEVRFGAEVLRVIATPGHTPACVCYLWRDRLFCGDTLSLRISERLAEDADPGALYDSVRRHIFTLPGETLVFPGHDLAGRTVSTIAEERTQHREFSSLTREQFITRCRREHGGHLLSLGSGLW